MDFFFGSADRLQELESKTGRIARSDAPILIDGATGTGKERVVRHLHELQAGDGLLVKFLCDSSPSAVFEGLDHGQEAIRRLAEAGQDEAGQDAVRLNPCSSFPSLISTASSSIERMAAEGPLLPGLFYRISVYWISMPPLRERWRDIRDLFRLKLEEISATAVTMLIPDSKAMKQDELLLAGQPARSTECLSGVFSRRPDSLRNRLSPICSERTSEASGKAGSGTDDSRSSRAGLRDRRTGQALSIARSCTR